MQSSRIITGIQILTAALVMSACSPGQNPSVVKVGTPAKIPTHEGSDPSTRVSPSPVASEDLIVQPNPTASASPSPTVSSSPSPSSAPSTLPSTEPISAECVKGIIVARNQYLKDTQLLRLRDKLDTLMRQVTAVEFTKLMSATITLEQARTIYINAAQAAKIDLNGSVDKVGKLKLKWTMMKEKPGVIAGTFIFDDAAKMPRKLKSVFLGYFPGEELYRFGYENADGSAGRDIESLVAGSVTACAGVRIQPKSFSTLESKLVLRKIEQ